jgi:hypothetical protein
VFTNILLLLAGFAGGLVFAAGSTVIGLILGAKLRNLSEADERMSPRPDALIESILPS